MADLAMQAHARSTIQLKDLEISGLRTQHAKLQEKLRHMEQNHTSKAAAVSPVFPPNAIGNITRKTDTDDRARPARSLITKEYA